MANRVVVRFARGRGPNAWDVTGAYRRYLRTPEVAEALFDLAAQIHADAGGDDAGFVLAKQERSGRRGTPRAAIIAGTFEAQQAEATERVLTRAFEKNRGS